MCHVLTMPTDTKDKPRGPKPVTRSRLHNIALHYLERFASSSENVRRVLMRRVERAALVHDTDRDEARDWINDIVKRFEETGLLDDRRYAENRTASLHRQGTSRRGIQMRLIQKGVDGDLVAEALEEAGDDFIAAVTYARKRRLGPYRTREREDRRERDLAALGRVGFSYETAKRIVDAETIDDLEFEVRDADIGDTIFNA